jgi:hypothetical protein
MTIPPTQSQILPRADLPAPIEPQSGTSGSRSTAGDRQLRGAGSRLALQDQFLYNIYKMGSNQIDRGSITGRSPGHDPPAGRDDRCGGAPGAAGRPRRRTWRPRQGARGTVAQGAPGTAPALMRARVAATATAGAAA